MDIKRLTDICNNDFSVSHLLAYTQNKVEKKTVRTVGEYITQRFYYIKSGSITFVINNTKTITCNEGDILYLTPDSTFTSIWESEIENSSAISIHFKMESPHLAETYISDEMFIIAHDHYKYYLKLFEDLVSTYCDEQLGYKIKCQSIFLNIYYSLITDLIKKSANKKNSSIEKGILFIENNYLKPIKTDEIADLCSLCPSAFRKKFRDVIGMSPVEYKNYLKMKKAAELLETGEFSIVEVAYRVGIDDVYYFNKLFKKYYKISPGKFKRQNIQ